MSNVPRTKRIGRFKQRWVPCEGTATANWSPTPDSGLICGVCGAIVAIEYDRIEPHERPDGHMTQ